MLEVTLMMILYNIDDFKDKFLCNTLSVTMNSRRILNVRATALDQVAKSQLGKGRVRLKWVCFIG